MEDGIDLKAMAVAAGIQGGQAEMAAPVAETTVNQDSAGMAVEEPANVTTTQEEPAPVAVATEQTPEPASSEPYNYWPDLESKTEGLVKDEESFSALIERAKAAETLEQEVKNSFKPANEYISKLNEMTLAGANPDQIKAFVKLNGYGDLETLSPIDLKVTKMVLTEGYSEEVARKIVNRNFDLNQFDEDIPEQKEDADIMREELRISAKKDLEVLKEYKKELSTVNNPEKENAEKVRLQQIADATNYNKTVEREAPNIVKHFPDKLSYEFKVGEETVAYEDSFEKQFLEKELAEHVKEYFKDSMDPVNAETVSQAYSFALGEYLKANDAKRLERAYQKGYTAAVEKTVNRYENKSGLPRAQENQIIATTESGLAEFTKKMIGQ